MALLDDLLLAFNDSREARIVPEIIHIRIILCPLTEDRIGLQAKIDVLEGLICLTGDSIVAAQVIVNSAAPIVRIR